MLTSLILDRLHIARRCRNSRTVLALQPGGQTGEGKNPGEGKKTERRFALPGPAMQKKPLCDQKPVSVLSLQYTGVRHQSSSGHLYVRVEDTGGEG